MKPYQIILWILIVVCLVVTALANPGLVRFWPFDATEFAQILAPILVIALIIERTLEVFLTAWRGSEAAQVQLEVQQEKTLLEADKKRNLAILHTRESKVTEYKGATQRIAFLSSFALGVLISAVGVRLLEQLADPAVFQTLSLAQKAWFRVFDVLLTGALLGGGSDGIHKIVEVFTSFMDETKKKIKGSPK